MLKNKLTITAAAACISILLGAFTNTAMANRALYLSGQFNPEFTGKRVHKIVVAAPNVVQHFRDQIEIRMSDELKDISRGGANALQFNQVVSPFKTYTGKEVISRLKSQGVDAVVIVDIQMAGGRRAELEEQRRNSKIPEDMIGALEFTANHKHSPNWRGKYRLTTVTLYHLDTGNIIWQGSGQVNGNKTSIKWHKVSGRMLARKFGKALKRTGILRKRAAPSNVSDGMNYTSGDEVREARESKPKEDSTVQIHKLDN